MTTTFYSFGSINKPYCKFALETETFISMNLQIGVYRGLFLYIQFYFTKYIGSELGQIFNESSCVCRFKFVCYRGMKYNYKSDYKKFLKW